MGSFSYYYNSELLRYLLLLPFPSMPDATCLSAFLPTSLPDTFAAVPPFLLFTASYLSFCILFLVCCCRYARCCCRVLDVAAVLCAFCSITFLLLLLHAHCWAFAFCRRRHLYTCVIHRAGLLLLPLLFFSWLPDSSASYIIVACCTCRSPLLPWLYLPMPPFIPWPYFYRLRTYRRFFSRRTIFVLLLLLYMPAALLYTPPPFLYLFCSICLFFCS